MITDPFFYGIAAVAVLIVGISKGGFGGGLGVVGVPLMSLAIPPLQAAAILLPILCVMDLVGLWAFRGRVDTRNLRIILPGATLGIVVATFTFGYVSEAAIRVGLGLIAVVFGALYYLTPAPPARPVSHLRGGIWSAVSGFTSFVAHAGGPPLNFYLLPQRLDRTLYAGTTIVFFAVVNYLKLIPYTMLGEFDTTNLTSAAILLPLAPVGVLLGAWLHRRVSQPVFYGLCYGFLIVTGMRLLWVGGRGMLGA